MEDIKRQIRAWTAAERQRRREIALGVWDRKRREQRIAKSLESLAAGQMSLFDDAKEKTAPAGTEAAS